ncbi:SDR family oxidoreductase [Actinosynnema sp. NPDC020468]|uniref:SDR family oxidoreductase n=1 Tax=Actinosynnema sp. NPDC020468 TaxID=3154488 RepID=UPI0033DB35BD
MAFDGKVALVTWAGAGVGAAVARRLDAGGARVAVLDDDSTAVELVGGDLRCGMAVRADASDPAQLDHGVDAVVEHYGRLDVLVTATPWGPCPTGSVFEVDDQGWHDSLGSRLDSVFYSVRAGLRVIRGGVIVAVAAGCPHLPHHTAAAGITALVDLVAKEAAPLGVRVHAVQAHCSPDPHEVAETVLATIGDNA